MNVSDNSSKLGFILLAPEGRDSNHFYPSPDNTGPGWDNWYRQFNQSPVTIKKQTYPENVDAATIDHFMAQVLAGNMVDTNRIYLSGWSNGLCVWPRAAGDRRDRRVLGAQSISGVQRSVSADTRDREADQRQCTWRRVIRAARPRHEDSDERTSPPSRAWCWRARSEL
jgi:predicted peptidase